MTTSHWPNYTPNFGERVCQRRTKRGEQSTSGPGESEDDADKPGCYVLDIENETIDIQRIWVRVSVQYLLWVK